MGYPNRRYRVVDGKLEKVWNGTNDPGWFVKKADAWAAVATPAPEPVEQPVPPPMPDATASDDDYETWKGPKLRSEIKARTGKGPKVGAESTKVAMIEKLRGLDAAKDVLKMVAPRAVADADRRRSTKAEFDIEAEEPEPAQEAQEG